MSSSTNLSKSLLAGVTLLALSGGPAVADTWQFANESSTINCLSGCGSNFQGNTISFQGSGGGTVTASGWANTVGSANVDLETGTVRDYSHGIGMDNADSDGQHGVDNAGRYDSVLFDFNGAAVTLNQVDVTGWGGSSYRDVDISVLAYTGGPGNPATPSLGGLEYGELTSNGWTLVQNATGPAVSSDGDHYVHNLAATAVTSSFWLVGALNPSFWPGSSGYIGNDYFKIYSLGTTKPSHTVPEPGTLALMALGASFMAMRRRKARQAAV